MKKEEMQTEALTRAVSGQSLTNYPAIFQGFMEKGIPESEILPRENVFTFNAWKALGRVVCKGEHGVRVVSYIDIKAAKPDPETGEVDSRKMGGRKPKTTTVFHISQTKPLNGDAEAPTPDAREQSTQTEQDRDTGAGESHEFETQREQDAETGAGDDYEPDEPEPPTHGLWGPRFDAPEVSEGGRLEGVTLADIADCPHTQRRIEPGMPCVACGDTLPDDYSEVAYS
jgi:hypothetical protein